MMRLSQARFLAAVAVVSIICQESSANVFGKHRALPKWFQGTSITSIQQSQSNNILARLDVRGGAEEESTAVEATVDVEDLYLPGLLDTIITRTNKVRQKIPLFHLVLYNILRSLAFSSPHITAHNSRI